MSTQSENVQINLKIAGIDEFKNLKDLNGQIIAQRNALIKMDKSDLGYAGVAEKLKDLVNLQSQWKDQLGLTRKQAKEQNQELTLSWTNIKSIAAGVIGGLGVSSVLSTIKDTAVKIKDAFAEAGANRAVLTNALNGNVKEANESLKMLMNFAAKTPEGLQQATDAFLKLVNRGIKPTRDELVNIGDVAASQKKTMDQYVEAIMDAQSGENERLKEFGIRASKNGDMVSFTFKGITKEVKNTEDAIYKALLSFGEMGGVKGTMDVMAKELNGISSNIDDTWDQIYTKLGQKSEGLIYAIYNTYSSVLSYVNENLLSTESYAEKLTRQFKEQASTVNNLEKNINPLLDRYDQLKTKGKLNKDEQAELKNILNQVAATIPGAVTEWDKYGNALDINAGKAREFIKIQQVMLRTKNKEAVDAAQAEIESLTKLRNDTLKKLNSGKETMIGGGGYMFDFKLSEKQIQALRTDLEKINGQIDDKKYLIKGLNGNFMDELTNKPPTVPAVSTARTEAVIEKEIKALKEHRSELDVHSKAYADYTAKIKKLENELNSSQGKKTGSSAKVNEAVKQDQQLTEEFKRLGVERVNDTLSEAQKEEAIIEQKYQKLIEKEKAYLSRKDLTPEQRKTHDDELAHLEANKNQALADLRVRVEAKMNEEIQQLRTSLANRHASELEKEKSLINKFYDEQEKINLGNQERIAVLKQARIDDLATAELKSAERLQDEKERIEASGETLLESTYETRLAKINKQYDDEIEALRNKYSQEEQLTKEFQDAIAAVENNRSAATSLEKGKKEQETRDQAIQGAEIVANTVFSISANNRKRESDLKLQGLEDQRQKELSNKNLTEAQKKAINDRYDAQVRAEKLRAWKADQDASAKQALISGLLGAAKAMPNFVLAALAMGTGIANAITIKAQKPPLFSKGGLIPRGPSHADGGIGLIDNSTGNQIGEMEGDEPIIILSKETARNNRALINELLFNSQFRNGARVSVNAEMASQAIRPFKNGGVLNVDPASSTLAGGDSSVVFSTKSLEDKLDEKFDQLIDKWSEGLPFNYRNDVEYRDKIARIKNSVNA